MRIGLLVGMETSFPQALARRLDEHTGGSAEVAFLSLDALRTAPLASLDVVLDRASGMVPFYRAVTRQLEDAGGRVVNAPRSLDGQDRFRALERCGKEGLPSPRVVLLPHKEYPSHVGPEALRNLAYPLDWEGALQAVGGSGVLRAADPSIPLPERPVSGIEDLLAAFDLSGGHLVMLQETLPWERYLRCLVFGGERVVVCRYEPAYGQAIADPAYLTAEEEEAAVRIATVVSRLLRLDLNAVDLAVVDGQVRLVDPFQPFPDLEVSTLSPFYFEKAVEEASRLVQARASGEPAPFESGAPEPEGRGMEANPTKPPRGGPEPRSPERASSGRKTVKVSARKKVVKKTAASRPPVRKTTPRKGSGGRRGGSTNDGGSAKGERGAQA